VNFYNYIGALNKLRSRNSWFVGKQESAGINRHVVGDARALQERK
jgi:hypothetical protein